MSGQFTWTALQPFGVKVDLDLSGDVSDNQIELLRRLYNKYHLLLFSGQSLSAGEQARISAWFGPVSNKASTMFDSEDPEVGLLGDAELAYHSDLSCAPEPLEGISLFGINVGKGASPTRFVSAINAASSLEPELREKLASLHTINLWPINLGVRQRRENSPENWPGTIHPVLKPHPRSGKPVIYVNASHTDRIVELGDAEGEDLLEELFRRLYDPANLYEHTWADGDFIVWDNLALQHSRPESPQGVPRKLQRVEIGSASYKSQMPQELYAIYAGS